MSALHFPNNRRNRFCARPGAGPGVKTTPAVWLLGMALAGCDGVDSQAVNADAEADAVVAQPTVSTISSTTEPSMGDVGETRDWSTHPGADNAMAKFSLTKLAVAELVSSSDSAVEGYLEFYPDVDTQRMRVDVHLARLEPASTHAVHVHAVGDCSAPDAKSAGGHFAPYGAPHGDPAITRQHHVGDLGNVVASAQGQANASFESALMAFSGPASVLNKAVIVHAGADDFSSQPAGAAGARIACGVINATRAPSDS